MADFVMHWNQKIDKGSPIETGDVSSNVSLGGRREGEVVACGFATERDSVLDHAQVITTSPNWVGPVSILKVHSGRREVVVI